MNEIKSLTLLHRGAYRDSYRTREGHRLIVTTDQVEVQSRIFKVENRGRSTNPMAAFWCRMFEESIPHHLTDVHPDTEVSPEERMLVWGRSIVVKELHLIPVRIFVGQFTVWGVKMPEVMCVPSGGQVDPQLLARIREVSTKLYLRAYEFARARGLIIADTRFRFGLDENSTLTLTGEVLTPDSSTFWAVREYEKDVAAGRQPVPFEKRPLLEWLSQVKPSAGEFSSTVPPPKVLADVATRYHTELAMLCVGRQ